MSISFNEIPGNLLTPIVAVEFDNTAAVSGPGARNLRTLLIGQRLSTGTQAAEEPVRITNADQVDSLFGKGSLLADMARTYFRNNQTTETFAVALDDAGSGIKASGEIDFTGPATADGVIYLYVGGRRITVGVESGDAASAIATAIQTELAKAENAQLPVQGIASTTKVVFIARNAGAAFNEFDLRLNYNDGESLPEGVGATVTQMASGAVNPDIEDALGAVGDTEYNVIIHPYTDATNLTALDDELLLRWGPLTQNDGVGITAKKGTLATLGTFGQGQNKFLTSIIGLVGYPTPPWRVAAAAGAQAAFHLQIDPARPLQTLALTDVLAPKQSDRLTRAERQLLLQDGLASVFVDDGGTVRIERMVMTYKTNPFGAADPSYRDLNTIFTLSYIRWDWRNYILRRYPRHKLAGDEARFGPGQAIVTPKLMKAEAVLKFTEWELIGLVEDVSQFKNDLIVAINSSDPNRLDVLLPPNLVNQLRVVASKIEFRL